MAIKLTQPRYSFSDTHLNVVLLDYRRKINEIIDEVSLPIGTGDTITIEKTYITEELLGDFTEGSIPFGSADGYLEEDNLKFSWTDETDIFNVVGTIDLTGSLNIIGDSDLDGAVVINESNADKDFRVEGSGATYTHLLFVDASANMVGVNEDAPKALYHIRHGTCVSYAGVHPWTALLLEGTNNITLQLQAGSENVANIVFADDNYNPPAGRIQYDFNVGEFNFVIEGNERVVFTTTGAVFAQSELRIDSPTTYASFIADSHNADAYFALEEDDALKWTMGFDYSDSRKFQICEGIPGTSIRFEIETGAGGLINLYQDVGIRGSQDLRFYGNDSYYVGLKVPAGLTGSQLWLLPSTDADAANKCLQSDAAGNLGWSQALGTTDSPIFASGVTIGNLTLADGSITDSGGAISFEDENLSTSGTLGSGEATLGQTNAGHTLATTHRMQGYGGLHPTTNRYGSYGAFILNANATYVAGARKFLITNALDLTKFAIIRSIDPTTDPSLTTAGAINSGTTDLVIDANGNVGFGTATFGTNAVTVFAQATGTAPTTSPADSFQMYSADIGGVAGKAAVHFRDEAGNVTSIGDGKILDSSGAISFGDENLSTTGNLFINDASNSWMGKGITINQGAADNEILAFKSSDIAHGMTDITETDTYGYFQKAIAAEGGLTFRGFSSGIYGFDLQGVCTTPNTTKTSAGLAPIILRGLKKSAAVWAAMGANENVVAMRNSSTTIWLIDAEGDSYQRGGCSLGGASFGTNAVDVFAQATGTAPTSSPADSFQMYSADIGGVTDKAGVHFRGEDDNIVSIGTGGLLSTGTARTLNALWVDAQGIKAPQTNPAELISHGTLENPAFQFADAIEANQESVTFNMRIPNRMDRSVVPTISIGWSADGISPGNCRWQLEYLWTSPGEDTGAAAQEILPITGTADDTADGFVVSTFTGIDVPSATDFCLHCRITRLSADELDTIEDTVELHGVCLNWTSNKLGLPT